MVPLARVAAMPPIEAFAPGSTGNISPVARSSVLSASRVTPGWTTASMSSARTSSTRSMRIRSITSPPWIASACPSSEVPAPQPITGTPLSLHTFSTRETSAVFSGKATASGGGAR